jgi:hypothetical protein
LKSSECGWDRSYHAIKNRAGGQENGCIMIEY